MPEHRFWRMYLSLTHPEQGFLITMVNLNLPAIKIGLHQTLQRSRLVSGQQVSRFSIIRSPFFMDFIGLGSNDNQTQGLGTGPTTPQDILPLFHSDPSATIGVI